MGENQALVSCSDFRILCHIFLKTTENSKRADGRLHTWGWLFPDKTRIPVILLFSSKKRQALGLSAQSWQTRQDWDRHKGQGSVTSLSSEEGPYFFKNVDNRDAQVMM